MKNIVIFAHYDRDNIIDDSVVYYLEELKKISEAILFVSDSDIDEVELKKLDGLADYSLAKKHGEYDFGSYKRGYNIAKKNGLLDDADNLLFVNDSCVGPFSSIEEVFNQMNAKECDFWGITTNANHANKKLIPCELSNNVHLQSYFLVFKKSVFSTAIFENFVQNIKKEETKEDIIEKYEIGLSVLLCNNGFKFETYSDKQIMDLNIRDFFDNEFKEVFIFEKKGVVKEFLIWSIFKNKIKANNRLLKIVENLQKRIVRINRFDIIGIVRYLILELKYFKKYFIRIHFKEKRIYLFGKWYMFD